jgi:hypothetical protein
MFGIVGWWLLHRARAEYDQKNARQASWNRNRAKSPNFP